MRKFIVALVSLLALSCGAETVIDMTRYGIRPDRKENMSPRLAKALSRIKTEHPAEAVTLRFAPGEYNFHPQGSCSREYYISNHDQDNPKSVGIAIENWDSVTIDGGGASFVYHGRMLPIAVTGSRDVSLCNLNIDFANPHISQVTIVENDKNGITFRTAPWVTAAVDERHRFVAKGEGWSHSPRTGIAFEPDTRHLVYRSGDLWIPLDSVVDLGNSTYLAPRWRNPKLIPGTVVALRGGGRPTPGIFLADNVNTSISDIKVHYAEGMGLLAQMCHNIDMQRFSVCLKGDDDKRYFTTQADATHFSGCSGLINSTDGLYEGMMDDAINVHGTYLRVIERIDSNTLRGRYMHGQSYGFRWGEPGDTVQPVRSRTMEAVPEIYVIESITPVDADGISGAKVFDIRFTTPVNDDVKGGDSFGLENLTRCPAVYFAGNVIRNNRARGSLFSTPRRVVVEDNLFDHTSGTAILLCGDCMGWFETGACRDVTIHNNRFVNSLTNMFQFTEAIISIYPEIHDLAGQKAYFHGGANVPGVVITDNEFDTFDNPVLYAKSIYGVYFVGNVIRHNTAYPSFHTNNYTIKLERAKGVRIHDNNYFGKEVSISVD